MSSSSGLRSQSSRAVVRDGGITYGQMSALVRAGALFGACAPCLAGVVALGTCIGGSLAWATLCVFADHPAATPAAFFVGVTAGVGVSMTSVTAIMLASDAIALYFACAIGAAWGTTSACALIIYEFDAQLTILGVSALAMSAAAAAPITCLGANYMRHWAHMLPHSDQVAQVVRTQVVV